ncbi:cell wall hydrolase [Rhodomicrobium sp. Az07]|uniref:cell wall hydrolase n=1 Tax=Rhodomicrobium sp. Az07 TaxID=2839034 RepID=UPI001BEBFA15|nr:cell wall hydrolase [Rhodomicrobium sp. Az07]MBT3070652.1 cell wall hydrolase [Rhodomicrobium sp. Az07]
MRSSRPMTGDQGQSRALVSRPRQQFEVIRKPTFAVEAPHAVPLTLKARRSFVKLAGYTMLAGIFAIGGYAWRDPDIRRAIDYRVTLLTTTGVSQVSPTLVETAEVAEPLTPQVAHLFYDSQKGPRADKFAYALKVVGTDTIARRMKANPLRLDPAKAAFDPTQTAALASASLFMTAFAPRDEALDAPTPPESREPEWAGLLRNASLSPEQPKTLFGGLTEDEFRARELRCMATAIYFEARDEPAKGQIAVAQVVMNRIRSPFYPKTICGVVYQGERRRTGCQFSFTCTGKRNSVKERKEWATAVKLAKQVIAGEVWLDEVSYATHYHATYVHPSWRHELIKVTQIGGHIFYRMKPGTVQLALLKEGL